MTLDFSNMAISHFDSDKAGALAALVGGTGKVTALAVTPAHMVSSPSDPRFARALRAADVVVPLSGSRLSLHMSQLAARYQCSVFFLGKTAKVAKSAAMTLRSAVPELMIAGTYGCDDLVDAGADAIETINESNADVLILSCGVVRQDIWIYNNRRRLAPHCVIGVGDDFDGFGVAVAEGTASLQLVPDAACAG